MTDRESRPIAAATSGPQQMLAAADISQLVAVTMRLAMELATLRERLRTHEALLVQHGLFGADEVEGFVPSADELQTRLAGHRALIESLAADLSDPAAR